MAMLTQCFFCKRRLVIPSADEAYEITDEDKYVKKVEELSRYTKDNLHGSCLGYSCGECFRKKIFPHLFE